MVFHRQFHNTRQPLFKRSALALAVMACAAQSVAQESESDTPAAQGVLEQVVVTGVRQNLENAQDIKRNADTFVDAISSEDMGSLPDRSVLEAMQRLPGVSIERFAAADDPDHFSVEGSGAVIRGMSATRSEFNGRDSFSANSGRGLSFQDVPPELMGSVQIFKNQSADMIEGGIGGTVSLHTRKPFDQPGRVMAFSVEGTWGDLAEEWTPTISGLFSDRWETAAGEFGFLVNASHSELVGVSHGIQSDVYKQYPVESQHPWTQEWETLPGAERFANEDRTATVWMPQGSNMTMKEDRRERQGLATSLQWKDDDGKYQATVEYIRSEATLEWWENALKYQGGYTATDLNTRPYGDTELVFDDQGLFQSGFLADGNVAWRADGANVVRLPNPWDALPAGDALEFGHTFQADTRGDYSNSVVEDISLNFEWTPNDAWTIETDYQHIEAESETDMTIMMLGVNALQQYDVTGSTPQLQLVEPWGGLRDENRAAFEDGTFRPGWTDDPAGDSNYFQDPTSYWYRAGQDHYDRSEGVSDAVRVDVNYALNDSIITDIKGGVRWAEREQTVRNTGWSNWGGIGPEWGDSLYLDEVPEQADRYSLVDWSNFHRGDVLDIQGGDELYHLNRDAVAYQRDNRVCPGDAGAFEQSSAGNWIPLQCRAGVDSTYGMFLPQDISVTSETNNAAYVRADFAFDDLPMRIAGNIGLRYVKLERESVGYVQSPGMDRDFTADEQIPADLTAPLTGERVLQYAQQQVENDTRYNTLDDFYEAAWNDWIGESFWYLSDEERAWATQGEGIQTAASEYDAWLPSLNIKLEITDDLIGRFAASKAIAYPDMGDVRNNVTAGVEVTAVRREAGDNPDAEAWESAIQSASISDYRGSGGNTYLQPMESIQYDMSLEWYFASTGSLTGTVFYKDLSNFFVHGASLQPVTNPATGQTAVADITSTRNGGEGEMYGFEIAHQQFFDMLPEPFDGIGVQANYTWIEASGVPNNEESYDDAGWIGGFSDTGARVNLNSVPLQGQSEHTANLVLMYDKSDWSARLAYNWRSKYLLTTRDVISKYPLWNDAAGFMDGSLFYHVNDTFTVGVQATNLLNTQSETLMILDDEGTEAGRSWFVQDRRVSLIARAQF